MATSSSEAPATAASPEPAPLPSRIVFFDGVCGFCDGAVRWLIAHDPEARLRFAPLQGDTAARVRARFPERFPTDLDTFVYLRPAPGTGEPEILLRSAGVFALFAEMDRPWRWLAVLRVLPTALADLAYRAFAASRYRLFGRVEYCPVPSPDERSRLLP